MSIIGPGEIVVGAEWSATRRTWCPVARWWTVGGTGSAVFGEAATLEGALEIAAREAPKVLAQLRARAAEGLPS